MGRFVMAGCAIFRCIKTLWPTLVSLTRAPTTIQNYFSAVATLFSNEGKKYALYTVLQEVFGRKTVYYNEMCKMLLNFFCSLTRFFPCPQQLPVHLINTVCKVYWKNKRLYGQTSEIKRAIFCSFLSYLLTESTYALQRLHLHYPVILMSIGTVCDL
jgi:hypothetical protein